MLDDQEEEILQGVVKHVVISSSSFLIELVMGNNGAEQGGDLGHYLAGNSGVNSFLLDRLLLFERFLFFAGGEGRDGGIDGYMLFKSVDSAECKKEE